MSEESGSTATEPKPDLLAAAVAPAKKTAAKRGPGRPRKTAAAAPEPKAESKPEPKELTVEELREMSPHERPCTKSHHVSFQMDGVTLGDRVYYRGEEFDCKIGSDEWGFVHNIAGDCTLDLTRNQQVRKYGNVLWEPGPWQGVGYMLDETDETGRPLYTDQDREALARANEQRGLLD